MNLSIVLILCMSLMISSLGFLFSKERNFKAKISKSTFNVDRNTKSKMDEQWTFDVTKS